MACRTGKIEYPSPQAAHRVVASMCKRHEASKRAAMQWAKGRMNAYHCPMCGHWHVGHTPAAKGCRA